MKLLQISPTTFRDKSFPDEMCSFFCELSLVGKDFSMDDAITIYQELQKCNGFVDPDSIVGSGDELLKWDVLASLLNEKYGTKLRYLGKFDLAYQETPTEKAIYQVWISKDFPSHFVVGNPIEYDPMGIGNTEDKIKNHGAKFLSKRIFLI